MLYHSHTESIVGHTNSGFGASNLMVFGCGCQPTQLLTPLYKETYLREFSTESDKAMARMNLGITNNSDITNFKEQITQEILAEINKNNKPNNSDTPSDNPSDNPLDKPDTPGKDEVDAGDIEYDGSSEW